MNSRNESTYNPCEQCIVDPMCVITCEKLSLFLNILSDNDDLSSIGDIFSSVKARKFVIKEFLRINKHEKSM